MGSNNSKAGDDEAALLSQQATDVLTNLVADFNNPDNTADDVVTVSVNALSKLLDWFAVHLKNIQSWDSGRSSLAHCPPYHCLS